MTARRARDIRPAGNEVLPRATETAFEKLMTSAKKRAEGVGFFARREDFLGCALLAGLGMAASCKKARLPRIVGMLAVGLPCGKLVERSDKNERKGTDEGEDAGTRPSHSRA